MILAAGLGSRLRPITERLPKALVTIGGGTLLDHVVERLVGAGADRLVVNTHHEAPSLEAYLKGPLAERWPNLEILISHEEELLETGGGVLRAAGLFRGESPVLVHNVDVLSEIDLTALVRAHLRAGAVATLAMSERSASRYLRFDREGLCGRVGSDGAGEWCRPARGPVRRLAFSGIHAISPTLTGLLRERGAFSIIDAYLRLASDGHRIRSYDVTGVPWMEVGTPERLAEARRRFAIRPTGPS